MGIGNPARVTYSEGLQAQAAFLLSVTPTIGDLVYVGDDTYEFDGTGSNINVAIGGSATAARANLTEAINTQGTTNVVADDDGYCYGTSVRIQLASSPGGAVVVGYDASIALDATMTAGNNKWVCESLANGALSFRRSIAGKIQIDTHMLAGAASGAFNLRIPFAGKLLKWSAYASTGAPKTTTAKGYIMGGPGDVLIFETNTGATPLVNGDYIIWEVFAE